MAKAHVRKKEILEQDVYTKAKERVHYIYDLFDEVVVSFSGGKDSTAVLNIALEVARERDRLPLKVVFFDEEAIHPPTIEYVHRVADLEEIDMEWYCLEVKHRNAAANSEPFWYTWDKEKEDKWVRPLPENAITEHPRFKKGMSFQEFSPKLYTRTQGRVAMMTGIRTEESLRRYQVIAKKKNDSFIQAYSEGKSNQYRCFPIYDWSSEDVWLAVHKFGWDYNRTYDLFNKTDLFNKFLKQRVCPPFGEEPLRGLSVYAECFPEMWHKMLNRVDGVATAWRYANTDLYSKAKRPDHITYREYLNVILDSYEGEWKNAVKKNINSYIRLHHNRTSDPIEEEDFHPVSGVSWEWLCRVAIRGDFKGRQSNYLNTNATNRRNKLGITLEQAQKQYGKAR